MKVMTMNLRNLTRRASTLTVLVVAMCMLAGTAMAYWTSLGRGSGQASTATFGAPQNVTPGTATTNSVELDWIAPEGVQPSGYTVTANSVNVPSCAVTVTACTASGLTSATTYSFVVTSLIDDSWTESASAVAGTTLSPAPVIATPTVTITSPANNAAGVVLRPTITGTISDTSTVNIKIVTTGETDRTGTATRPNAADPSSWSFTPSSALTAGKTYTVTVTATNAGGAATPATSTFTVSTSPVLLTLSIFDDVLTGAVTSNGRLDRIEANFDRPLTAQAETMSGNSNWTLSGALTGMTVRDWSVLASPNNMKASVRLNEAVGAAALTTAVPSTLRLALTASAAGPRGLSNNAQASFAATLPADKAGPVPTAIADTDGSVDGRFQANDTMTVTFSEPIAPRWGSTSTTVVLSQSGGADTIAADGFIAGTISTGSSGYITSNTATFAATLSQPAATSIRVTLGACAGTTNGCNSANGTAGSTDLFTYAPHTSLQDAAGNAPAGNVPRSMKMF